MADDATHIRSPVYTASTLCGVPAYRAWNVVDFSKPRPDEGSGCWTCLQEAERLDRGLSAALGRTTQETRDG